MGRRKILSRDRRQTGRAGTKIEFHITAELLPGPAGVVRIRSMEGPLTDLLLSERILMAALMGVRRGPAAAERIFHRITPLGIEIEVPAFGGQDRVLPLAIGHDTPDRAPN